MIRRWALAVELLKKLIPSLFSSGKKINSSASRESRILTSLLPCNHKTFPPYNAARTKTTKLVSPPNLTSLFAPSLTLTTIKTPSRNNFHKFSSHTLVNHHTPSSLLKWQNTNFVQISNNKISRLLSKGLTTTIWKTSSDLIAKALIQES